MTNPIGLMIQAQGLGGSQRTALLNHVTKAQYTTVTVMDDFQLCRDIKDRLPSCVVVFRSSTYEPVPSPNAVQGLLDFLNGIQSQDKRIVIMINCENGYSVDHVNMWLDFILAAHGMGWRLCVGNVSSGSVKSGQGNDQNEWINAIPLFKVMASHPGHYLGFHDYSYPYPWAVSNGAWGEPNNPPAAIDWTKPQWHIGRNLQGIKAACQPINCPLPQMIVTEGVIDNMGDIESYFGYKGDGYRLLAGKYSEWYPGKDIGDVLADFHQWTWEKVYQPFGNVIGMHIYCYGDASGINRWANYRVDNNPRYLERMEQYAEQSAYHTPIPPPPFSYGAMIYKLIEIVDPDTKSINLRATPSDTSVILESVIDGDRVSFSENSLLVGKYRWHKVSHERSGKIGFMAELPSYLTTPIFTPEPPPQEVLHTVVLRLPGLTLAQAKALVNNVEIKIEGE